MCCWAMTLKIRFVGLLRQRSSKSKVEDYYANRNIILVHVIISELRVYYHREWLFSTRFTKLVLLIKFDGG